MGEKEQNGFDKIKLPENTWVIIIIFFLAVCLLIVYNAFSGYKHVSKGRYVGPKVCSKCHKKEAKSWSITRMANSFEVLRPGKKVKEKKAAGLDPNKDYTHDQDCLPCHTTGFGLVGGFKSIEKTPDLAGVTCEACHGPGGIYSENYMAKEPTFLTSKAREEGLIYPPTTRICRRCHNEDSPFIDMNYKFDYKKRLKIGTHEHYQLKYNHSK